MDSFFHWYILLSAVDGNSFNSVTLYSYTLVYGITGYIGRYHRTAHDKKQDIHFSMLLSYYDTAHNICNELMILMVRKHAAERSRWHMKYLLTV